jgi:hypothetical protein
MLSLKESESRCSGRLVDSKKKKKEKEVTLSILRGKPTAFLARVIEDEEGRKKAEGEKEGEREERRAEKREKKRRKEEGRRKEFPTPHRDYANQTLSRKASTPLR